MLYLGTAVAAMTALIGAVAAVAPPHAAAATTPRLVAWSLPFVNGLNYGKGIMYGGQVVAYRVNVTNRLPAASGPITVTDVLPVDSSDLLWDSATCGGVAGCSVTKTTDAAVQYSLSSAAVGVTQGMSLAVLLHLPGGRSQINQVRLCNEGACFTVDIVNLIHNPPLVLSSTPPGEGLSLPYLPPPDDPLVPVGQTITFKAGLLPYVFQRGDSGVTIALKVPQGMTYTPGSATCGSANPCTASESNGVVTYTIGPAAFVNGWPRGMTFAAVNNTAAGPLELTGTFNGGTCATTCFAASPLRYQAVPGSGPTIATALASSSMAVNGSTYDTATLSGATPSAGGSVDYRYYASTSDCSADASAFNGDANSLTHGTDAGTVAVSGAGVPNSVPVRFAMSGTYYFAAFYSGDANNTPASSPCTSEPLSVSLTTAALKTGRLQLNPSTISPGGSTVVSGSGCPAGSLVMIAIDGANVARTVADSQGRFSKRITPKNLRVGPHKITATCGPITLAATLNVVATSSALNLEGSAALFGVFVLLGVVLVRDQFDTNATRRRKRRGAADILGGS